MSLTEDYNPEEDAYYPSEITMLSPPFYETPAFVIPQDSLSLAHPPIPFPALFLRRSNTSLFESDGTKVVVDTISLSLITGSKVDYSTELIGSQFKIIDNPAASSNCGYVTKIGGKKF
jgi:hypothetical protein